MENNFMENKKSNLSITEILSKAFKLCTDNFIEILKVICIFILPSIIIPVIFIAILFTTFFISSSVYYYDSNSILDAVSATIGLGSIFIFIILTIILTLVSLLGTLVIVKILDDANKGLKVSWKSALRYVWNRKWSLLGLNILVSLIIFVAFVIIILISVLLTLITFGIGGIIVIPLAIAIGVIMLPATYLFNSVYIVNDLKAIDTIRETFNLFKKGSFWATIGKLAAISGIMIGLSIVIGLIEIIPFIGLIIAIIGQQIIVIYGYAYFIVFVLDKNKPIIENFNGNDDDLLIDGFIDPID